MRICMYICVQNDQAVFEGIKILHAPPRRDASMAVAIPGRVGRGEKVEARRAKGGPIGRPKYCELARSLTI